MKINGHEYIEGRKWNIKGSLWTMWTPINGRFKIVLDCNGSKKEFSTVQSVEKFIRDSL